MLYLKPIQMDIDVLVRTHLTQLSHEILGTDKELYCK